MNAIPSKELRERMFEYAKQFDEKYYVLLLIGFNTGLRISDILKIRVRDVSESFILRETKTGKQRTIKLSKTILGQIERYIDRVHKNKRMNYLVYSRHWCKDKPLTRVQAYKILRRIAETVGLMGTGTHCMRKSFAHDLFRDTKDINVVRDVLNHKYTETTMRYLFTPDILEKLFEMC
jgi:integrase